MTDAVVRDPGLQPERTALSWSRTALAVTVNALLAFRTGLIAQLPAFLVVGAVLLVAAAAAIGFGIHRRRQLERRPDAPLHGTAVAVAAAVCLLACATGVASIIATG